MCIYIIFQISDINGSMLDIPVAESTALRYAEEGGFFRDEDQDASFDVNIYW